MIDDIRIKRTNSLIVHNKSEQKYLNIGIYWRRRSKMAARLPFGVHNASLSCP